MKISVIVPVYNTEKYLNKCVDSILAQTFTDFELLLIDDGSTDGSGKICDGYALKDGRVKVFHKENGGVSRARNLGLDNATGEYLSFVDSDDFILPDMYEKLIATAEKHKVDIVSSDLIVNGKIVAHNNITANTVIGKEQIKKDILPSFTVNKNIALTEFKNKIFLKERVSDCRFPEELCYQEDLIFIIQAFAKINSMYYLPEAFYNYIPLPTGLYSAYRKTDGANFIKARNIILSLIERYDIQIDVLNFDQGYLYNVSWYVYRTLRLKDKKERKKLIYEVLSEETTLKVCEFLKDNATSFDRRIAKALYKGKTRRAIFLIKFVYSGKAAKLQKFISKLKRK